MNASEILTNIKMDLGIYSIRLPFEDPDKEIMNVIRTRTLRTFSSFYPQIRTISLDLARDLEKIKEEYTHSIYILPDIYGRDIIHVRSIIPKSKLLGNGFISPVFDGSIETYNMMMMTQASANLASVAAPPITIKFEAPNKLHIYNMATAYGMIDLEVAYMHADNLSSIPHSSWETFYDLALLDVKRFLFHSVKHFDEIQSAYGTIQLKIDDWSQAESDRKELVEKMRDTYHLEVEQMIII